MTESTTLNEYVSIVQSVETRPLKSIEEYAEDYRQHVLRRRENLATTASNNKTNSNVHAANFTNSNNQPFGMLMKKRISSKYLNPAAGYRSTQSPSAVARGGAVPAAPAVGEAPHSLADDVAKSQRRLSTAASNQAIKMSAKHQAEAQRARSPNWHHRLYNESVANREAVQFLNAAAKEEAQRLAMEEERQIMEQSSVHKSSAKPSDATFARLYISGKSKERWCEQQRASQEAALTQKASPSRRRTSMDRDGSRDVFEHLYQQGSAKRNISPKQNGGDLSNRTPHRLDLSERHISPQSHRTPVITSSRREKLHQRLFDDAAERHNNLAMMKQQQEADNEDEEQRMFHPDLNQARSEITRGSSSAQLKRRTSMDAAVGPDGLERHSPRRQGSSSSAHHTGPTQESHPIISKQNTDPTLLLSPKVKPVEVLQEEANDIAPPPFNQDEDDTKTSSAIPPQAPLDEAESAVLRAIGRRRTLVSSRPSSPGKETETERSEAANIELAAFPVLSTSEPPSKSPTPVTHVSQGRPVSPSTAATAKGPAKPTLNTTKNQHANGSKPLTKAASSVAPSSTRTSPQTNSLTPPPIQQKTKSMKLDAKPKRPTTPLPEPEPLEDVFQPASSMSSKPQVVEAVPSPTTSPHAPASKERAESSNNASSPAAKSPQASSSLQPSASMRMPSTSFIAKAKKPGKNSDSDSSEDEDNATTQSLPSPQLATDTATIQEQPSAPQRTVAPVEVVPAPALSKTPQQQEVEELRQSISQQQQRRQMMLQAIAMLDSDDDSEED